MNIIAQAASGSINLLRLSGPQALKIASSLLSEQKAAELAAKPRTAVLARLSANGERIDSALVIYFAAPASFTGEDVVEFHIHGGYFITEQVLLALHAAGARTARPGEFSKRACINGKMSLEQALLINELINAKSQNAHKIINKNIDENFASLIEATQQALTHTLAHIETAIDYADDDLPPDILERAAAKLAANAAELAKIAARSQQKRALIEGFCLAIIGEPNVGKSSLLNALLEQERAIVSSIAGTTRDSVEEQLQLGGHLLRLVDTAGIREHASDEIERIGIERSRAAIKRADIVLFLADASQPLSAESAALLAECEHSDKALFVLLNKCDLPLRNELAARAGVIQISAANGEIAALKTALLEHFARFGDEELILSNATLIAAFNDAAAAINHALAARDQLELCAHFLLQAQKALGVFSKQPGTEELYDAMFSSFCLGK